MKKQYLMFLLLMLFSVMGFSQVTQRIEAETFNAASGARAETNATLSGGGNVGYIQNNTWIKFTGHVFNQYDATFTVAASGTTGGNVEFRLDASNGTLIGTATVSGSTGWSDYKRFSTAITPTTGTHDLYLVFTGGGGYLFNVDYFEKVTNDPSAVTYTLTTNVSPALSGTVSSNPAGTVFTQGTAITLTANKNFGYQFTRWVDENGTQVSTANPYTFTITSNTTLVAEYAAVNTYNLTVNVAGAYGLGEYSISPAGKDGAFSVYETGTNVTITAIENDIVKFKNWSNGATSLSTSLTMDANKSITGTYDNASFIAGWTFKTDQYAHPRVAELYPTVDNRPLLYAYNINDNIVTPNVRLLNRGGANGFAVWNTIRGDFFYFMTSFSTVGYKNINVSSGLIGYYYGCDEWTLQYSLDGVNFVNVSSLTTINTNSITSIGGVLPVEAEGKSIVYLRWFPNVNGPKHGSAIDVTATLISNLMVKADVADVTVTWNGTAWSNGTPDASKEVIIDGTYSTTTNGAFIAKKLTVNSGSLTINSGTNLTVQNEVINNAGANGIVVENNANLVQVNNTTNTGNVVVNRNSNALSRLDYTMWSSPVASQNLATFSPLTSQSPSRFYTYNSGTNAYNSIDATTTNFAAGTGYLIRMPNTAVTAPATETFAGQFTGIPNNGNIGFTGLTAGLYYAVGNPYPSTLSADLFLSGNATDGTLYFWRKTNAAVGTAYATYTALGGAGTSAGNGGITPNGTIQVGQGFIVKPTGTTLNFTNAMRTSNNSNQIFRIKNVVEKDRVWLNLTNTAGVFSQALVGYINGATQDVDTGIDGKYINDSPVALTSAINGEEYTIQGRALPFDPSDVVPLNFKTDVTGDYIIAIDHVDGLFATGQDVYLVDSATGTETNLKTDAYTFTATKGTANSRFSLKYQKTLKVGAPTFNENSVVVFKNNGTLYVNSGASTINNIKVFDIQGRLIAEQNNVNANTTVLKNWKANQQVLIVKVTSQDNTVVNKKVVN